MAEGALGCRVRGVEYEMGINTLPPSQSPHQQSDLVQRAIQGLAEKGYVAKVERKCSAPNAGMVYDDMGHLEICTPSYSDPLSAAVYDKAAEIYALGGAQAASRAAGRRVVAHKTNYSVASPTVLHKIGLLESFTSYATHGNISVSRSSVKDWNEVLRAFIPNNVARIVFMGSGEMMPGIGFELSPRAMFVSQESSLDTTENRGIVNERCWKEGVSSNYADPEKYMRLHDIHFEGLRCDWNIIVRDIWQTLLVSTFEKGLLQGAPRIRDPVGTLKSLSRDWEARWRVEDVNGSQLDVVEDILRGFYWDRMLKYLDDEGVGGEKAWAGQIELLLQRLSERRLEVFEGYGLDWATKRDWLEEYGVLQPSDQVEVREGRRVCRAFAWLDPTVLSYLGQDVDWESYECLFSPRDSVSFAGEMVPGLDWDGFRAMVRHALGHGPEATRDYFASEVLRRFRDNIGSRAWDEIALGVKRIRLPEPFMLNREEMGEKLAKAGTVEEVLGAVSSLYQSAVQDTVKFEGEAIED